MECTAINVLISTLLIPDSILSDISNISRESISYFGTKEQTLTCSVNKDTSRTTC